MPRGLKGRKNREYILPLGDANAFQVKSFKNSTLNKIFALHRHLERVNKIYRLHHNGVGGIVFIR